MKIKSYFIILISIIVIISCGEKYEQVSVVYTPVEAPFDMPAIISPDFSKCERFSILDFGADTTDQDKTSNAIAQAIDKASAANGGVVVVPAGIWPTAKIHLKSNVDLHLDSGAVLLFSENPEDYLPPVHTTWEGMECYNYSPLVYARDCKNVAITGKGELKAKMEIWEKWFPRPKPHMNSIAHLYHQAAQGKPVEERQMVNDTAHLRAHFIQFNRCENVLLEGVKITNSPFWVIHPYMSKHVTIRDVEVFAHGHNNDGVDPEMSENMLIEDCVFDQGDDAIAVKAGRNQDAWRLNAPCKNIVIRNCYVKNGHQLLAIGSELSGGIENVWMDNCKVAEQTKMYHLLFIKTNERRGGYVKNIQMSNIEMGSIDKGVLGIETDVLYQWRHLVPTYERRLTSISDVYLKNVKATAEVEFISRIQGQAELPVKNVVMENIKVDSVRGESFINENVEGFEFK